MVILSEFSVAITFHNGVRQVSESMKNHSESDEQSHFLKIIIMFYINI